MSFILQPVKKIRQQRKKRHYPFSPPRPRQPYREAGTEDSCPIDAFLSASSEIFGYCIVRGDIYLILYPDSFEDRRHWIGYICNPPSEKTNNLAHSGWTISSYTSFTQCFANQRHSIYPYLALWMHTRSS